MVESYMVLLEGLSEAEAAILSPEDIAKLERMAINKIADKARTSASKAIRERWNFKAGYLDPKLRVVKKASDNDLVAIVKGEDQPRMLARFSTDTVESSKKKGGVSLEVRLGMARFMRKAFIIRLRNDNLGLAWRSKDGSAPTLASKPKEISPGLFILYGPSVDQAFRTVLDRGGLANKTQEDVYDEFYRLLDLEK